MDMYQIDHITAEKRLTSPLPDHPFCPPTGRAPYTMDKETPLKAALTHPVFHRPQWMFLWLPALITAVLVFLIPLCKVGYYSLTLFDFENPSFIGFRNYSVLLSDPSTKEAIGNTLLILALVGGGALLLGWLLGSSASRLPRPVGIITAVLLAAGSLFALTPSWAVQLSRRSGFLNVWNDHIAGLNLALLLLFSIGPSFSIFYIGARLNKRRAAWHIAFTAIPILLLTGPVIIWEGSFSHADLSWLPQRIDNYILGNYIHLACALLLMMLILLTAIECMGHLLIWRFSRLSQRRTAAPLSQPRALHWCGGCVGMLCGLLSQIPLVTTLIVVLKPLEEMSRSVSQSSALWSFGEALEKLPEQGGLAHMPLYIIMAVACYLVLVLPTAAAMAFFVGRSGRITAAVWLIAMTLSSRFLFVFTFNYIESSFFAVLLAYITSPLLPITVLLTVWLLRKSTQGYSAFRPWIRQKRKLVQTGIALMLSAIGSAGGLLYTLRLYQLKDDSLKFPLQLLRMYTNNMQEWWGLTPISRSAAVLLIQGIGTVLLIFMLVSALYMNRAARKNPPAEQMVSS